MADVTVNKDLENKTLTIEFVVNAPKDKVWDAYTVKEQFEKWWGPEGWETRTKEFNVVPGGKVHYGMKCVDESQGEWFGQESWGLMDVQSVTDGESLTYKDYFSDEAGTLNADMPVMTATIEFVEEGDKTRVTNRNIADTPEQIEELLKMGMVEGFTSQIAKLDELFAV